jgi:hypothetical protein
MKWTIYAAAAALTAVGTYALPAEPAAAANYVWAPDYSTFIDRTKYPNAFWVDADPGGGSEGAPPRAGGFYEPGERRDDDGGPRLIKPWGAGGYDSEGGDTSTNKPNYRILKDAGLWNLSDPNSGVWKFLKRNAGPFGDPQTNDKALMWALESVGATGPSGSNLAAGYEQSVRDALAGLDPQFVNQFASSAAQANQHYRDSLRR